MKDNTDNLDQYILVGTKLEFQLKMHKDLEKQKALLRFLKRVTADDTLRVIKKDSR